MLKLSDFSAQYSKPFIDPSSDKDESLSVQMLIDSDTKKASTIRRKLIIAASVVVLIFLIVLFSVLLLTRNNIANNHQPNSSLDGISSSNLIAFEKSNINVDHRKSNDLNITALVTKPYRDPTTKPLKSTRPSKMARKISNRHQSSKNSSQIVAQIGDWLTLNCNINFPEDGSIPYAVQWWKRELDLPIYIGVVIDDVYSSHIAKDFIGRVGLVASADKRCRRTSLKLTMVKRDDSGWYNCKVIFLDQSPVSSLNGALYHLDVLDLPIDQHSHAMRMVEPNGSSPKPLEKLKGNMKSFYSKRSEMKIAYEITKGYSCCGIPIRQWKDGTHAKWGMHKGLSNCKNECNQHIECKGFVAVHSTGVCGHWKSGPLRLTEKYGKDRDCYMKKMKRYV